MQNNHHVGRLVRDVNFTVRGENKTKIAYFKLAINDLKMAKQLTLIMLLLTKRQN